MKNINSRGKEIFDCCIIGLGYIGLPTATVLASKNKIKVLGVDINETIIKKLNSGYSHFHEPNLDNLVSRVIKEKKLFTSTTPYYAKVFVISVPTPINETDSIPKPNLNFVFKAAESIVPYLEEGNTVILESTSPVGTTKNLSKFLAEKTGIIEEKINFAYCPERVLPGNIIEELENNDRVVGGLTKKASSIATNFYKNFCNGNIYQTNSETAEMVKLSENVFRDINLAYANELSIICDQKNINVRELIKLANKHPRVNILNPGCGVGGHCIAVDPWFLISGSEQVSPLMQTARKVNESKIEWSIEKIKIFVSEFRNKYNREPIIGCLGITFKPNVDDLRNSPGLKIVEILNKENYKTIVCEPNIKSLSKIKLESLSHTLEHSDLIIFLVAHNNFRNINLRNKNYLDFCGVTNN